MQSSHTIQNRSTRAEICRSIIGYAYALASAFLGAVSGLLILYVREAGAEKISLTRCVIQYLVALPVLSYRKEKFFKNKLSTNVFMFLVCATALTAFWAFNSSLKYIPLGDTLSLCYSYVALLGWLECLFLNGESFIHGLKVILVSVVYNKSAA